MSRISVEWIDEHRREIVTGSAIIIIFFLAVFWWYIFSTASTGPLQMSAISGVVFIDDDVDGVFSPDDEFGFPAVAIQLYDSSGLLTSEVTDDEGTFMFSGLDPGEYTVREILPNDWEATSERELDVTVAQGETLFLSFGLAEIEPVPIPVVLTYGTLSGTVYDDDNNNGEFDEGEIGVENVQIKLSNALGDVAELQTDSEGEYLFENIRTGEYRLNEVVPMGWYNTTNSIVKVVVVSEQVTLTDFGIGKVTDGDGDDDDTGPSSTITVQVFRDSNEDGDRDPGEGGITGVAISLYEGDELIDKQSTNTQGRVFFEVFNADTYIVVEEDLPKYTSTTPNEVEVEVVLETDYTVLFGDYRYSPPPPPPPSTSTIVGTVFYDVDLDGSVDQGEDGISGVTVSLERNGSPYRSDVSDSNGQVSFSGLSDGSYQLIETDPDGYFSTTPNTLSFSVTSGTYTGIFGDAEYASLYGYAFDDADGDGIFDEGEDGLYGATVSLYDDEGLVASVTTGEDGLYSFTELMPGIYEVSSDPVEGYFRTTPGSVQVELAPGDEKRVDFGYAPDDSEFGSVFGTVFNDKDGSTVRSLGELGLGGVEVTLTLVDDGSELTTTNEFGVYTFKITTEGSYNIHEENPTEWISTTPDDIPVSAVFSSDNDSPHDFGDTLGATVSGIVYEDENEDEVKDAEEEGVPDVTVQLLIGKVVVDETTTEEDGTYSFQVLASGEYTVEETDLEDWFSTTDNDVPVSIGELIGQVETVDFGDYHGPWGTIWGIVWDDSDGDGLIGEEDGIEGILVSLYDEIGIVATTTTDSDGEYWFEDLVPGIYDVETEEIDNYFRTTPGLVKPNVESGDNKQVNFGFAYIENDFGSLYGTVYHDMDGDGERDFTELGLSDVTIDLYPAEPPEPSQTTTTNEYGYYTFKITGSSTNLIKETNPTGYYSTTPNRIIQSCSIMSENDSPHDYGDNLGAIVSGMVYDDFDRDEVKDGDEVGVEGVTVELYLDDNPDNSTVTDENGEYSFLILKPGDYELRETDLTGWESSTDNELPLTVGELTGQEIVDKDFGDYELGKGRIKGIVFDDEDGDGIIDTEEDGIPGVTVSLYDEDDVFVDSEETDENGEYMFESLIPSKYVVRETNPDDYQSTTSDKVVVDLEEEEEEIVNFGDRDSGEFGGIYGTVWNDEDGDGERDVELGLSEVTVNLYTVEVEENTLVDTQITDEHGQYTFTDLKTDDYLVEEINLDGWTSTTPDEVDQSVVSPNTYEVEYGDIYPNPIIDVDKYVKDPQALTDEKSVVVASGTEVHYGFIVFNRGNVPLTNIKLEDDLFGDFSIPLTTILLPGDALPYARSHIVTEDITNIATVTATYIPLDPDDDDVEVSDEDSATVTVGVMEITVTKEISKDGSTWTDHVDVYNGDTVYYRFTVENTGTLTLTSVTLSDVMNSDPPQSITLLDTSLDPDESTTNAGPETVTAIEGENTNTATAKGWYIDFDVSDTDTTSYTSTPEPAKIFGKVFFDENKDKDIDPGEYGICCTTINLYKDNVFLDSDFTDLDGDYEFNDLLPGNYKVEEIERIPDTFDSTDDPAIVPLTEGEEAEINFGDYSDEGQVYGIVFMDRDGDGVQDSYERGISGVTIKLMDGETEIDSTTTDRYGEYEFYVVSGSYTVKEIDPGWIDASTTSNEVPVTVVNLGHHEANFGDTVEGGIDVYVFNDEDRDTYSDFSEDGIPDVEIKVHDDDGYIDSHYTWSSGWVWIDLLPGTYTIEEVDPEGYFSTTTNSHKITVISESWWDEEEFGDAQYQEDIRIDKQVKGRDGFWYEYDSPVGIGVNVEYKFIIENIGLDPVTGLTVTDDVLGTLDFMPSDLAAGEEVTETYTSTTISVKGHHSNTVKVYYDGLPIASDTSCYLAADPSSIYGMVFYDDDTDGVYDSPSDYPLKNVYIELYKDGVYYRNDKTDVNGEYSFDDLDPDYYKVKEIDTITDCVDSTPDEVEYRLKSGEDKEINFGDYSTEGILRGVVYLDKDKDGELDPAPEDRPLSGVTIKLWQGTDLVDSTTTNGDGEYSFDVNAGTYKVEEVNPTSPSNLYSVTPDIYEGVVVVRCDYTYRDFLDATDDAGVDVLVFNDIDRDGYFDDYDGPSPEHGLGGVTITVKDLYDNEDYYTTDSGGYVFISLTEGKYSIQEEDPYDYFSTTPNVVNVELDVDEQEDVEFGDAEDDPRATIDLEVQDGNGVWHDTSVAHVMANSPIKLKYTLTNTAVHEQHYLTVVDEWYGTVTTHNVLQPGESVTQEYTDTYGLPPDDWSRYVTVYSQESDGWVMDGDTVRQFAEAPEIMSYKAVKGVEDWYDDYYAYAVTGEKVYFRYTVVNQGNIKLTGITVEDDILGTISMPDTTIYPGDYTEKIVETTASDGQVINKATVTGDTILKTVSHWAEAEYYGYEPGITVTKSVSASPTGPWENSINIPVGDTVYYQYLIENTGDVYLENIVLEDSHFGTITLGDSSLAAGEITGAISEISKPAVAGTDENTATVTAEWHAIEDFGSWYGKTVSDDDDASYTGVDDKVTLVKEIKGSSTGWEDDKIVVPTGDDIQYKFTVTNDGNSELTNIAVTDDTLTDPITFPGGQTTLGIGESMTSDIITVNDVPAGIVTNEAKVTADAKLGPIEDKDTATYSAGKPKIEVVKEASRDEVEWKERVYVEWHITSPDKVYFRYTVTNTGDVSLTDIYLTDNEFGDITVPPGVYPPGLIGVFYAETDAEYGEVWNDATVYGTWENDYVDDWDDASYFGVLLDTDILKEVKVPGGDWENAYSPIYVETGAIVEYRFRAYNDGNTPVDITVEDDVLGTITMDPATVPDGDYSYSTGTYTHTTTTGTNFNEVTITSTYEGLEYEFKDSATVIAGKPELEVTKQVSIDQTNWLDDLNLLVEDTVYYKFTVKNIGDVTLENVVVYDTHFGTIVDSLTLAPAETKEYSRQVDDALAGKQENTVTANGEWEGVSAPEAEDSAYYFGVDADYTFTKEVMGYDGIWYDDQTYQLVDESVSYRFIIVNDGNVDLTDLEISDPMLDTLDPQQDPIDVGTVAAGSQEYFGPYTITAVKGSHTNTATLTGNHLLGTVNKIDTATYTADTPELELVKQVSTDGGDWTDDLTVAAGATVDYKFTVSNIGEIAVDNIELYDYDLNEYISLPQSTLQPGESMVGTTFETAVEGEFLNDAEVTGEWHGIPVSDTSSARYFGEAADMAVDKKIKGTGYGWMDDTIYVETGTTVYYMFTVENTGNVDLSDVQIEDTDLGISIGPIALGVGETYTSTEYDETAVSGTHTNTVTASATSQLGPLNRDDSATYVAGVLDLVLEKLVSSDDSTYDETTEQYVGQTVYYRFTVTNNGDVDIENIQLEDPSLGGAIPLPMNTLNPGESMTGTAQTTAVIGENENTATVSGEWHGIPASDDDTAEYFGMDPQITVDKKAWGPLSNDWSDTTVVIPLDQYPKFQYTITNTGNVPLTSIIVEDDVLGPITIATELAVGASDTATKTSDTLATSGLNTNTVTVTAMHDQKQVGPVTDQASYYGGTPGLEIVKLVKGLDDLWHDDTVILNEGDDVYYKYTVTNTGTTPVQGLEVIDDQLGPITMSKTELDIGESTEGAAQSTVAAGENTNTATATATSYDVPLEDEDTATYIGVTGEAFIVGVVFNDLDGDGELDTGEPGIGGVSIALTSPSTTDSTTTNPDGEYSFTITETGTHTVTETDPAGYTSTTPNTVDVEVTMLYDQEITVNFGDTGGICEEWHYYLSYEDACDNTFEDFGMVFDVKEIYVNDYLTEVQMEFTSRIYDSTYDHLIHIKRSINGASTVTVERPNPVPSPDPFLGKNELPAGTYDYTGDVDLILFNTKKYANPSKQMDEIVRVTITVEDPQANPKTEGTPPRQFQNEAEDPFYDLEPFWANYDPYMESNWIHGWAISGRIYTTMFGSPGIYVPRILAIPEVDWIPPYTGTCIVQPYGYFDDYYRFGTLENWWHSSMVTNNAVEYGGLSWGPYSLP